jgi:hypothetical protein
MTRAGLLVLAVVLASAPAFAQGDHLKCYKIKDSAAKALYTADLGGLAPEPGCQIKVPAKLVCVETTKTNVSPAPPGAPAGPDAGTFACYKLKCAKGAKVPITIVDQFGSRPGEAGAPKFVCAPAQVGSASATTTTQPVATTTTTMAGARPRASARGPTPSAKRAPAPWARAASHSPRTARRWAHRLGRLPEGGCATGRAGPPAPPTTRTCRWTNRTSAPPRRAWRVSPRTRPSPSARRASRTAARCATAPAPASSA